MDKIKSLVCCCCGEQAIGRQWFNRDIGYGLCPNCISFCRDKSTKEEMKSCYGIEGIHYNIKRGEYD